MRRSSGYCGGLDERRGYTSFVRNNTLIYLLVQDVSAGAGLEVFDLPDLSRCLVLYCRWFFLPGCGVLARDVLVQTYLWIPLSTDSDADAGIEY